MSVIAALLGGAASGLFGKLAGVVDKRVTTKTEREAMKDDLQNLLDEHVEEITKLALEQEKLQAQTAEDARRMAVAIQSGERSGWLSKNVGYLLDLGLLIVWGTCTVYLILRALKLVGESAVDLTSVLAIYSTLTACFMTSLTFHRGSSRGSEAKDAALRSYLEKRA